MNPPARQRDLWIVGAGPAGLALADACAGLGLDVGVVDPEPERPWQPNYGLWADDAEELGVASLMGEGWPRARIEFAGGGRTLERGYGLLDKARARAAWGGRVLDGGGEIVKGRVEAIEHDAQGAKLRTEGGVLSGRMVVDASGHGSTFVAREEGPPPGYQVAWGELWAVSDRGAGAREAVTFMDWRAVAGEAELDDGLPPTFLYVLPVAEDRVFIEETVLVGVPPGNPGAWFEALRGRLGQRLSTSELGAHLRGEGPLEVERCVIPMGGPLPLGDRRTLAYGGAASMVHPATGYMLTPALRRREAVAGALAEVLGRGDALGESLASGAAHREVWAAIWPADRVRAWRLYTFGMGILAAMDRPAIDAFFARFFELDDAQWRGFVSASVSTGALMKTMLRYFGAAPWSIQRRLGGALVGASGLRMARGFTGLDRQ